MLLQSIEIRPGFMSANEGGFVCSFEREDFTWSEGRGGFPVISKAIICPYCLEVWARMAVDFAPFGYSVEPVSCVYCNRSTDRHPVPGSLLDSGMTNDIDWSLIELLPEALLRREFLLHLRTFM